MSALRYYCKLLAITTTQQQQQQRFVSTTSYPKLVAIKSTHSRQWQAGTKRPPYITLWKLSESITTVYNESSARKQQEIYPICALYPTNACFEAEANSATWTADTDSYLHIIHITTKACENGTWTILKYAKVHISNLSTVRRMRK